jgi:hypothetical protein
MISPRSAIEPLRCGSILHWRNTVFVLAAILPALALAAAAPPVRSDVLIDADVSVSPSKVRPLEFDLSSAPARVLCKFLVAEGRSGVRAVLLRRADVHLWLAGGANHVLASTGYAESGGFMFLIDQPGQYAVVLDNRVEGRDPALVHLQVLLLSGPGAGGPVQSADPLRARLLVWGTILLFGLASAYGCWRLRLALARRSASGPTPEWPPLSL